MSESPDPMATLAEQLGAGLRSVQASMAAASESPRYHYIRVPWGEVNKQASQGYVLCAMPPHTPAGERGKEGGAQFGPLFYVMARPLGPADDAAAMLEAAAGGGAGNE